MNDPPPIRRPFWQRLLIRWSLLLASLSLLVLVLFASQQRTLMYPALKSEPLLAANFALPHARIDDVTLATVDGLTLHGWHISPTVTAENRSLVIYLHGNGGHRAYCLEEAELLLDLGCEVLVFDYRGYAENPGAPTQTDLVADAHAMWQYARDTLGVPAERIVIWGQSLGGGVATQLVADLCEAETPPGGLVLYCTFSSMTEAAEHHFPWLPVRTMLLDRYDSVDRVQRVTCPVLVLHGTADRVVPLPLAKRLFAAIPEQSSDGVPKRMVVVPEAGHSLMSPDALQQIRPAIRQFLTQIDPATTP